MRTLELHCSVDVIKVGATGNTAAAAAAYIACDRTRGYDGQINDYRNKPGFVAGGLLLPEDVPDRWREDPSLIWPEQDLIDYTKSTRRGPNAELYRSGNIGLPWELSFERASEVANEMLEPLREKGMVVQWAIHDVIEDGKRNFHLHWMSSMRETTPDGFGNKNRSWNKYNGGLNIPELLRPLVADILNRELQAVGSDLHVEHESFEARGIDKIPTKHMGPAATALERDRKDKKGNVTREAIATKKGERNRYIEFLNQIHAENLRQVEVQTKSGRLDDLIAGARAQQGGNEAFKDWDALFAMLRDTRRCRAALTTELGKLGKVVSAYEEDNEGYLRWAGCDPDDDGQKTVLQLMQDEIRIQIKALDVTEAFLLDSKELYKAHNRAFYMAKKAAWDKYQIDRSKRGIDYCTNRLEHIDDYISSLIRSITLLDIIFRTEEYREFRATLDDLYDQRRELQQQLAKERAALAQAKKDRRIHKRDAREAAREERKAQRQLDRER